MAVSPTSKEAWRAYAAAARDALSPQDRARASRQIMRRLLELPQLGQASSIFCYVAVGSEVQTASLLERLLAMGKVVAVPHVVASHHMEARRIRCLAELVPGRWGIPHPPITAPVIPHPCLAVVPGLAFSECGQRIGRGGGAYDSYLRDHPSTLAIAVAYDSQIFPRLPTDPHDIPMRLIVTPSRVIECPPP